MSYISDKILSLIKQLFPKNGRAYRIPIGSDIEKLMISFGGNGTNQIGTNERLLNDANKILDSLLPDNENFTDGSANPLDNDCDFWERKLNLVNWGVTPAPTRLERMAMIDVRRRHSDSLRQSAGYIQSILQQAGFNVYVYENLSNQSPDDIIGSLSGASNLAGFNLGSRNLGEIWDGTIIANYLDEAKDSTFVIPDLNYHGTFFISGNPITTFANVPAIQKKQFRQLLLNLKPANMVGFLFVTYI